jgi:hypothetical protein
MSGIARLGNARLERVRIAVATGVAAEEGAALVTRGNALRYRLTVQEFTVPFILRRTHHLPAVLPKARDDPLLLLVLLGLGICRGEERREDRAGHRAGEGTDDGTTGGGGGKEASEACETVGVHEQPPYG